MKNPRLSSDQEIEAKDKATESNSPSDRTTTSIQKSVHTLIDDARADELKNDPIFRRISYHPLISFDEVNFYHLLARSVSLDIPTKHEVLKNLPDFTQSQINDLIDVLEHEQKELEKYEITGEGGHIPSWRRAAGYDWLDLISHWGVIMNSSETHPTTESGNPIH